MTYISNSIRIGIALIILAMSLSAQGELVSIEHRSIQLNANWAASEKKQPAFLIVHGTLAHAGMEITSTMQELLDELGYSSLAINLSLGIDNRSFASYPCEHQHSHKHQDAIGEIEAWADWLKAKGYSSIALVGHSRGGSQVVMASLKYPEIAQSLFLLAPMTFDLDKVQKAYKESSGVSIDDLINTNKEIINKVRVLYCQDTSAKKSTLKSYYQPETEYDTVRLLRQVKLPVQLFVATEDQVVTDLEARARSELSDQDNIELVIIDGADHMFLDLYLEDVVDAIDEKLSAP